MRTLADLIRTTGQRNSPGGQDSVLAHITPKEARLLKRLGGVGTPDPVTGALHFYSSGADDGSQETDDGWSGGYDDESSYSGGGGLDGGAMGVSDETVDSGYGYAGNQSLGAGTFGPGPDDLGVPENTPDTFALGPDGRNLDTPVDEQAIQDAFDAANMASTAQMAAAQSAWDDGNQAGAAQAGWNAQNPAASQAARDEWNEMGFKGLLTEHVPDNGKNNALATVTPWSYDDLDGTRSTNFGSIGRDVATTGAQYGGLIGMLLGNPAVGAAISTLSNMALGNFGPAVTTAAGFFGGAPAALGASVLSNLMSGREGNALNTGLNAGLNYSGFGLGQFAAGQFAPGSLEAQLAGYFGSMAQGALTSQGLNAMGVTNSGQGFGGWTGGPEDSSYTDMGTGGGGSSSDSDGAMYAGGSPTFDEGGGGSGQAGNNWGSLFSMLSGMGGQTNTGGNAGVPGYAPITLDQVSADTGYDLIDQGTGDNTLGGLLNLANAQNLYASSYGG